MRYNVETDMVEIFYNGVWQEWTSAELQQFLIYNYGEQIRAVEMLGEYAKGSDNIRIGNENTGGGQLGVLHTSSKIDLRRYNTLHIDGTFAVLTNGGMKVAITNAKNNNDTESEFVGNFMKWHITNGISGNGTWTNSKVEMDISALTGEYYIRLCSYRCRFIINKIYLT